VLVPADAAQAEQFVEQSLDIPGPVYLRLGRGATPAIDTAAGATTESPVRCGHAQLLRRGDDIAIVACGPYPVLAALEAAGLLAGRGVSAAVVNMHTVKPLDTEALNEITEAVGCLVTVEEHWSAGGLGAAVAEALADRAVRVLRIGVPDTFVSVAGSHRQLLDMAGVTTQAVVGKVAQALGLEVADLMA
jgi:transketolase